MLSLAWLFLVLGATSFGGPVVHIAMMEEQFVRRRQWFGPDEFADLIGATNLIPGPNSTEMAIHIGYRRHGRAGLLVAGTCFILPAVVIVWAIAWAYTRYGRLPEVEAVLRGIKPVVIAVVVQALWSLGRSAIKTPMLAVLGLTAAAAVVAGIDELLVLALAGLVMLTVRSLASGGSWAAVVLPIVPAGLAAGGGGFQLSTLFFSFLKIGSVLFGSGYVLLAFLRSEFVEKLGWLTEGQLLDALAIGQLTPGPLFTTATFVGFLLGGHGGALVATAGIFLPAFVFVALSGPLVPKLRRSKLAGAFLDGVNVASLALMAVVTVQLARAAIYDRTTLVLAVTAAVLLLRFRVNSAWLVLAGALVGWFLS